MCFSVFVNDATPVSSSTKMPTGPFLLILQNMPGVTPIISNNFEGNQLPVIIIKNNMESNVSLKTNASTASLNKPEDTYEEKEVVRYINPFDYSYMLTAPCPIDEELLPNKEQEVLEDKINWLCIICAQEYHEKNEFIAHYEMHKIMSDQVVDDDTNKGQQDHIICPVCDCRLKSMYTYRRHIIKKHKPKEYACSICEKNCECDYTLSLHLAQHNPKSKTLLCNACKKFSTTWASELATHINENHLTKEFFCKECGENFTSETWFNDHKIFHFKGGSLFCDQCEVYFANQRNMINHMRNKHNIKVDLKITKFKCFKCDLTFPKECNLRAHNRVIHPKPKDFLCTVCGKGFPYQHYLTEHFKIHEDGKYVCSTCGKIFKQKTRLTLHLRVHTGEKPNKCQVCDKSFSQKSTLNVHVRTHTGERPYPCARCTKGFITKTIRDTHQKKCKKNI